MRHRRATGDRPRTLPPFAPVASASPNPSPVRAVAAEVVFMGEPARDWHARLGAPVPVRGGGGRPRFSGDRALYQSGGEGGGEAEPPQKSLCTQNRPPLWGPFFNEFHFRIPRNTSPCEWGDGSGGGARAAPP